jgi:hypothetical protein
MDLSYILSHRTNGANPFKIFENLPDFDSIKMFRMIRQMDYETFLQTAYWFAVSMTVKSRAGMRCQVCNSTSSLTVHHRTYDSHGREHLSMNDLVALCVNCHGLFHGHGEVTPQLPQAPRRLKSTMPAQIENRRLKFAAIPHTEAEIGLPYGDEFILTEDLIDKCRANGAFTTATAIALGVYGVDMERGWPARLVGKTLSREQYRKALEGRFIYRGKKSDKFSSPPH